MQSSMWGLSMRVGLIGHSVGISAPISGAKHMTRKPHVNVGTIGHIDYGKQTFVTLAVKAYYKGSYRPSSYFEQLALQSSGKGGKKARKRIRGW